MVLIVVLAFLTVLIIGFLLIPMSLHIDTDKRQYYIELGALAKASVEPDNEEVLRIAIKLPLYRFYLYPLRPRTKDKKSRRTSKPRKQRSTGKKQLNYLKKGMSVLRSFKVKQFDLEIDTGDCISNAKLYPVFALLNYRYGGFHVNFEGRNRLALHLQNRPVHIIKSFINN